MNNTQANMWTTKTTIIVFVAILFGLFAGVLLTRFLPSHEMDHMADPTSQTSKATEEEPEEGLYTCSMHPHLLEHGPGPCPICGMNMVPVSQDAMPTMNTEAVSDGAMPDGEVSEHSMSEHSTSRIGEPGETMDMTAASADEAPGSTGEREVLFYRNPMDPTISSPVPAKDSMGMDYVPVYADQADTAGGAETREATQATVRIDAAMVQNMNVRTAPVERRDLTQSIRTVGYLEYDQQRMVTVTTKYSGFIEKVFVNYIGEKVRRGAPLFEIYSPELVQTEQDLLSAVEFAAQLEGAPSDAKARAEGLIDSARTRLSYWDISKHQIEQLEQTGEVFRTLRVTAPASGLVMKRMPGLEGMAVQPGMELFHIADLSSLWLSVELFEDQVAWVHEGTVANIELSYFPGEAFKGSVRFLEPELSDQTRTIRAKIEVRNPKGRLRTGMYATVEFEPVMVRDAIAIPTEAILRTGTRSVVILALGDGRFAPQEVQLGHEAGSFTQIVHGLEEGMTVVISSQFLLDSESKLRTAIQKMIAARS